MRSALLFLTFSIALTGLMLILVVIINIIIHSHWLWGHKRHMRCHRCPATSKRIDLPTFSHVWHSKVYIYIQPKYVVLHLDDETRVVLEEIPKVLGSDYINASWINVRELGPFIFMYLKLFSGL